MNEGACAKCGSGDIVKDVKLIDHGHYNGGALDLSATVYTEPNAWVLKMPISHRFQARVCGACGYTEFYVENPRRLFEIAERVAAKNSTK